jgi:hypothetical protein
MSVFMTFRFHSFIYDDTMVAKNQDPIQPGMENWHISKGIYLESCNMLADTCP